MHSGVRVLVHVSPFCLLGGPARAVVLDTFPCPSDLDLGAEVVAEDCWRRTNLQLSALSAKIDLSATGFFLLAEARLRV